MVKCAIAALLVAAAAAPTAFGGELLLLDFASPYCGPCQSMVPIVQGLEAAGYHVRRVDTTREPQMAQQYHVSQIPCFIMLADGHETERIVGATSQQQLITMYRNAMGRVRGQSPDPQAAMAATSAAGPVGQQLPATNNSWNGAGESTPSVPSRTVAHAAPVSPREPLNDTFSRDLVSSSVRLRVDDPTGHSFGTGTIIDARSGEALVITCGHLFRDSQGKGPILVELFAATEAGVRVVAQVPGQVIGFNLERDLGLISIRPNSAVRVAPVATTKTVLERGERLTSVGCDRGADPTALATRVTNIDRYQGPPNVEASGAPVEGRSGGGLFNAAGELVGVCFAADYEGNEGLYTALDSIHDEMDRLGLSDIYRKSDTNQALAASPAAAPLPADQPVVRGQELPETTLPFDSGLTPAVATTATPNNAAVTKAVAAGAAPGAALAPAEQAALDEISRRAADSEVVCIIRPREPGGKSEVITLPQVSPEFVRQLAERASAAPATLTR